ncbi:protein kilB [Streptomyces sp. NPDC056491]|uniref:protein kilB n=1 Tax=Streptomyces sp. NPDC056491 TaxID=3345837 RepID=UPI0036A86925
MLSTVIAVLGTLAGALVAGGLQHFAAHTARQAARAEALRTERIGAVTDLATALADHRRAMWVREDLRLSGAPDTEVRAARAESHATRSALTAPRTRLSLVFPDIATEAEEAVIATFTIRDADTRPALNEHRDYALASAEAFTAAATEALR